MRIAFDRNKSSLYGEQLAKVLAGIVPQNGEFTRGALHETSLQFHRLTSGGQATQFSDPLWSMFSPEVLRARTGLLQDNDHHARKEKIAIIVAVKDGIDLILEADTNDGRLFTSAINIDKGGLAANIAEAIRKSGFDSIYIALHGDGEIAELHKTLLTEVEIDTQHLLKSGRDGYIHPCIVYGTNREEFWLVQKRSLMNQEYVEEFTAQIKTLLRKNNGKPLVLCAIAPPGAGEDYFARLAIEALNNNSTTIYNPKQYDDARESSTHLFNSGNVGLIKPNIVEFVLFLQYAKIIDDSENVVNGKIKDLKKQIQKKDIKETVYLARELMKKYNFGINMVLVSFGELGSLLINNDHAIFVSAPEIKLACSSGAGDAGLGSLIVAAKEHNMDLRTRLKLDELEILLKRFNVTASATASLEGNQISSRSLADQLFADQGHKLTVIKFN